MHSDEPLTVPADPITLLEAISHGSYLDILKAQRRDIVASLPEEKGQARATLHRHLRDISKEIDVLEGIPKSPLGTGVESEPFDRDDL